MMGLVGCDFSSRPGRKKPIVLALGQLDRGVVRLERWVDAPSLEAFADWLRAPGSWLGAFDLPFGLPRPLVEALGWPTEWTACLAHYASLTRQQIRDVFAAYCDARPAGAKLAHRKTDLPAGSSPSMKWVNPPVAYMLHAGVPLLVEAGVTLPGLYTPPDPAQAGQKIALEAYPGFLARQVLGTRSYKSDDKAKQNTARWLARKDLLHALETGQLLGLRLRLNQGQREAFVDDASGDRLDAVLCLLQAAWAAQRHQEGAPCYGLPADLDPLEGWIIGVPG
jgi:hypothetical protein